MTQVPIAFQRNRRGAADRMAITALSSGGRIFSEAEGRRFMAGRGVAEPDGDIFELFFFTTNR